LACCCVVTISRSVQEARSRRILTIVFLEYFVGGFLLAAR
jgi:hypothetical protein